MKLPPSFLVSRHLLLLLVVMIMSRTASSARKARLVRVVGEDDEATASVATSSPSTTPSPWMFANIENTTHDGIIAMEGCECTCDCSTVDHTPPALKQKPTMESSPRDDDDDEDDDDADNPAYNNDKAECSCSCQCQDPEHEARAKMLHLQEHTQAQRERRLNYERELRRQNGSMCDKNCPGKVKALKLWDAKKQYPIRIIKNGDVVCRPNRKVNLEAVVKSTCDESVEFRGSFGNRVENERRYFQFGNYRGKIFGKRLRVGRYVVRTRVFSENNAQGVPGKEKTFRFAVVECPNKRRAMSKRGSSKRLLKNEEDPEDEGDEGDVDEKEEPGMVGGADDDTMTSYRFHFAVAGLPGPQSSILLEALSKHDEIAMGIRDMCDIVSEDLSDDMVEESLDKMLDGLIEDSDGTNYGFNCPTAIFDHHTISRMEKHSPELKFVIGLPHPILMLEDLYNSRVSEAYDNVSAHEKIPSFDDATTAQEPWKDVSLDATRFELFLIQLAKMTLTTKDMMILTESTGYHLAIRPNKFSVFLYTYEQIHDTDEARVTLFREELQSFLDLSIAIPRWRVSDERRKQKTFPESISICDAKWAPLRANLLPQASDTATWILNRFVTSNDVHVANLEHFSEALESWGVDPCTLMEQNDVVEA